PNQARCRACSGVVHITPPNGAEVRARAAPRESQSRREPREVSAAVASSAAPGAMTEPPAAPAPGARVVEPSPTPLAPPARDAREPDRVTQPRATSPAPRSPSQSSRAGTAPPRTRRIAVAAALILAVFIGVWIWWTNHGASPIQAHA